MKTIDFDETDALSDVLGRFCRACDKTGLKDPEKLIGEDLIRSLHSSLVQSESIGNQAHIEKTVGTGRNSVRIVGRSSRQRRGLRRLLEKLFGR